MSSLHPSQDARARHRRLLLGTALLSLTASLGFVLAPVERPEAVYSWPGQAGDATAVAIPLMTERPTELTASGSCADVRGAEPGTVLVSSTPIDDLPGVAPLPGLRIAVGDEAGLVVRTADTEFDEQELPDSCTWQLRSTPSGTTLTIDGEVVEDRVGDLRPSVAGVFSELDDVGDLAVDVTADTVFQTSPSALKRGLGVVAVLALIATLVLVARGDRGRGPSVSPATAPVTGDRASGRRGIRWLADGFVLGVLTLWTVIGPLTVDDGYIAGIVHSRDANGYIGNVHRWFNAPEAPFGWFYEVLNAWSRISASTTWMRVPSSLLGVATWLLLSRGLLPRLGERSGRPWYTAVAALVFLVWWLPTNLGLRPEPWVAAGLAAVLVLVERALRRQRVLPLAVAAAIAGATLAVTPTGAVAFLPLLAAAVPVLKLARRTVGLPVIWLVTAAAAASALLLMFADQSLGAVLRANEIRTVLPGSVPWDSEAQRWAALLTAGDAQGALARRVPVLLTLAAVVGIVWHRLSGAWDDDGTRGLADRLTTTFGLSLVVLLFTPTKWTLHFGALAPLGTALVVLACTAFDRRGGRTGGAEEAAGPAADHAAEVAPRADRVPVGAVTRTTVALTVLLLLGAWAYSGWNQWAFVSDRGIPWRDISPELFDVKFSSVLLAAAGVVATVGAVIVVSARVRAADDVRLPAARWVPTPGVVAAALVAATVLLEVGSFVKASYGQRDTYTLAGDLAATVSGHPCGLAEDLSVETDPLTGLLPPATPDEEPDDGGDAAERDGFVPVEGDRTPVVGQDLTAAGVALPGWAAEGHTSSDGTGPATLVTGWYELPDGFPTGDLPLVVTTSGSRGVGTGLQAEFGRVTDDGVELLGERDLEGPGEGVGPRDARLDPVVVPAGAALVRLVARDGGAATALPLAVAQPRVPSTQPFDQVLPADVPSIVDWPVAFVFPCQRQATQVGGTTDVPGWRIASLDNAGDIVVSQAVGGPYAPARSLVTQVQVPVYLDARPMERPVRLFRWEPRLELDEPRVSVRTREVSALED
ncbi:arabinosyltransferase domain-containing protein [Blastococcus sp. SYSU D00813]